MEALESKGRRRSAMQQAALPSVIGWYLRFRAIQRESSQPQLVCGAPKAAWVAATRLSAFDCGAVGCKQQAPTVQCCYAGVRYARGSGQRLFAAPFPTPPWQPSPTATRRLTTTGRRASLRWRSLRRRRCSCWPPSRSRISTLSWRNICLATPTTRRLWCAARRCRAACGMQVPHTPSAFWLGWPTHAARAPKKCALGFCLLVLHLGGGICPSRALLRPPQLPLPHEPPPARPSWSPRGASGAPSAPAPLPGAVACRGGCADALRCATAARRCTCCRS